VISIPSLTLEQEAIDRVVKELEELGQVKNVLALSSLQRVQIDQNDPTSWNTMYVGVVTVDPAQLILPEYSDDLAKPTSVVLGSGYHRAFGTRWTSSGVGRNLNNMPVGSRTGLYVDAARRLHFVFDGRDQGIVANNIPHPCYTFFDICRSYKK
ncbi:hypothetical protein BaRGS_00039619, partial [Batillaria attramentaria]